MSGKQKEEKNSNLMIAAFTIILLGILCAFIYIGYEIWEEYRDAIIDNEKEQMLTLAQSTADNFEVFIRGYSADLDTFRSISGGKLNENNDSIWQRIESYIDTHKEFVMDIWLANEEGTVLRSVRGMKPLEYFADIQMDETTSLRQCSLGQDGISLLVTKKLENGKTLSVIIDTDSYYQTLISNVHLGSSGYVLLKDPQGVILVHPEKSQWGIQVIEGRMKLYENLDLDSLEQMIKRQTNGEKGVSEYYSYWWMEPGLPRVKKISAYCPANLGDSFVIVSAVIDYNDIYVPVAEGYFKLVLVFLGILLVVLFMGFHIRNLMLQKRKVTEEVAYLRDLNRVLEEMHQSEELIAHQQRLQIMGTMTGGVAHEFNNLLTPIMGYAELLMMEIPQDSAMYDDAAEIYEASLKAKDIIQQISSLSRRNIETVYKNIHVSRMLERALKMAESVCPVNVKLENHTDFGSAAILGNETQMNQVILNIGVNAIHAIGHKEGTIIVTGGIVSSADLKEKYIPINQGSWNSYVNISIRDNGSGMSEETIKQIFDPFFTTKKNGKGTGLGLSLAEQIITSHKGYIFVESELSKGSTFHIFIPQNEQKEEYQQFVSGDENTGLKILIVDDNPKVLKMLEKNFAKLEIRVITCLKMEEARKILHSQPIDVIVAKQYISGISTVDFFMFVMATYPEVTKIIMMDRLTKEMPEAKRRGIIDEYIEKPASDTLILEAVARHRNINKY